MRRIVRATPPLRHEFAGTPVDSSVAMNVVKISSSVGGVKRSSMLNILWPREFSGHRDRCRTECLVGRLDLYFDSRIAVFFLGESRFRPNDPIVELDLMIC